MFTIFDVKNRSGYFCECAKQAFSLLRFAHITEILKVEKECKILISEIVEDLSSKICDARIFLDILSKTVIEGYLDSLKEDASFATGNKSQKWINSITSITDDVTNYVTNRLGLQEDSIDIVEESAAYIEPNVADYGFRDALQIANIAKKIYAADDLLSKIGEEKADIVEAKHGTFYEKYNNEALSKISSMRESLDKINNLRSVLDSCTIAKYLRNYYNLNDSKNVIDFLNCQEFDLVTKAIEAATNFMKG